MRKMVYILIILFVFPLTACGKTMAQAEMEESETTIESVLPEEEGEGDTEENSIDVLQAPSRDEVLAMREKVLKGMSQEEIDRLKENIKVANLRMESAYLNENIFDRLSDKDSAYWQ